VAGVLAAIAYLWIGYAVASAVSCRLPVSKNGDWQVPLLIAAWLFWPAAVGAYAFRLLMKGAGKALVWLFLLADRAGKKAETLLP